ncbi:MAG: hypothetical protein M3P48_10590 [Actinomycetota bacterium]|nr:hypothetical protein [Actinomycetota bacterium]
MTEPPPSPDLPLQALDELCIAVRESVAAAELILARAETIRRQRADGVPYNQIVPTEAEPLIVELISDTMARLARTGSAWRREEARALHREGMTMERIAQLFGVTRQRVSALLNAPSRDSARGGSDTTG